MGLLVARTGAQQLIVLGGTVYLARVLGPKEFGAFWIVQFVLSFFTLFGDAGFGAALIQKKSQATEDELSSVFWAQLLLGVAVVSVVFMAAPLVVRVWPALPESGTWMLRALSVSLLLASSRAIPAILMERELLFGRLSVIDLVLTASFNISAVLFAHFGFHAYALVFGVLVQGVAGLVAAYAMRPWRPRLRMRRDLLRPIMRFGLTFQAKNIVAFLNSAVMPLYAGTALGTYAFGLVSWSQATAFFPVQLIAIAARVNFPLLSRLQHDGPAFAHTLRSTVRLCAFVSLLFVTLFLGLAPAIVQVVYGGRWTPALPTLYVFSTVLAIGFIVPTLSSALDALGKPQVIMHLSALWTALNWLSVTIAMQVRASALSFALGYCVHIVLGNLAVLVVFKKLLPQARIWTSLRGSLVAGAVVAAFAHRVLLPFARGPFTLAGCVLLCAALFAACCALFDPQGLAELLHLLRKRQSPSEARAEDLG